MNDRKPVDLTASYYSPRLNCVNVRFLPCIFLTCVFLGNFTQSETPRGMNLPLLPNAALYPTFTQCVSNWLISQLGRKENSISRKNCHGVRFAERGSIQHLDSTARFRFCHLQQTAPQLADQSEFRCQQTGLLSHSSRWIQRRSIRLKRYCK